MNIYIHSAEDHYAARRRKTNDDGTVAYYMSRIMCRKTILTTVKEAFIASHGAIVFFNPTLLEGLAAEMYKNGELPFYGACWKPEPVAIDEDRREKLFYKYAAMVTYNVMSNKVHFDADGNYNEHPTKVTPGYLLRGTIRINHFASANAKRIRSEGKALTAKYDLKPPFNPSWIQTQGCYMIYHAKDDICVSYTPESDYIFDMRSLSYKDNTDRYGVKYPFNGEHLAWDAYNAIVRSAVQPGKAPMCIPGLTDTTNVVANGEAFLMTFQLV